MDNKIKHLEMIQEIINRMAKNSFTLKGWTLTLVAGIFTLFGCNDKSLLCLIAYIPIVVFWGLDSYYLLQERLFRTLYNKVSTLPEDKIDFNMNTNLPEFKDKKNIFYNCLFSKTEIIFYLSLVLITMLVVLLIYFL